MLPIQRKSIEPLAAHIEPQRVRAKHQALHHFVAKSAWSDAAVLRQVRAVVQPVLALEQGNYWIIDDSGLPKQGRHSVGVARQYCGQLGKTENCQVVVSLSLASDLGSVPIQWRLYLPEQWTTDAARCAKAGVPETVTFATKTQIALEQVQAALQEGVPPGIVLADPAYGDSAQFRDRLSEWGLAYAVGVRSGTCVWAPGTEPVAAPPHTGKGRAREKLRGDPDAPAVSIKALAQSLPREA